MANKWKNKAVTRFYFLGLPNPLQMTGHEIEERLLLGEKL